MKKKLFLFFACLLLALCVKPAPVQAAPDPYFGEIGLRKPYPENKVVACIFDASGKNKTKIVSGLSYNRSTNTLTISNLKTPYELYVKMMGSDFKVQVKGTNTVDELHFFMTATTIQGTGKLTSNNGLLASPPYEARNKTVLTIKKGVKLTLNATSVNFPLMIADSKLSNASKAIVADIPASKIKKEYVKSEGVYDYIVTGKSLTIGGSTTKTVAVKSVKLNKTKLSLQKGKSATLKATISPTNATTKTVTWSSSNPKVATVKSGKVTAKAKGTTTITVTTKDGKKTAKCKVTVTAPKMTYYGTSTTKKRLKIKNLPEATSVKISGNTLTIKGSLGKLNSKGVQSGVTSFTTRKFTLASNCKILLSGAGSKDKTLTKAQFNKYNQSGLYLWITLTDGKVTKLLYGV